MKYYIEAFKKYFVFSGRTSRKAFWMFFLMNIIIAWVVIMVDKGAGMPHYFDFEFTDYGNGPFYSFYNLLLFIPTLAISFRRLHDVGKSGWWIFITLIPVIGLIWLIVLLASEGEYQTNQYGGMPVEE